jgi:AI-2 transport protein TqsA
MKLQGYFFMLAGVVLTFYLLIIGQTLIIPIILAVFIWYLINVFASTLGRLSLAGRRLPAAICYLLAVAAVVASLGLLVTITTSNIADVIATAPVYQKNLDRLIAEAYQLFNIERPPDSTQLVKQVNFGTLLSQSALAITGLISSGGLILLYVLLLFTEQKAFGKKLAALFPATTKRKNFSKIVEKIDVDIRAYIGIKSLVASIAAVCGFIILKLIGLDYAAFWAILIFMFNFIPKIGGILAAALPALLALLQFESHTPFFVVAGSITLMQLVITNAIEPRLMSNSLNMSPLVLMIAIGMWGALWGITGMFLGIPIMVILMIIFSHFPSTRPIAILFSRFGEIRK